MSENKVLTRGQLILWAARLAPSTVGKDQEEKEEITKAYTAISDNDAVLRALALEAVEIGRQGAGYAKTFEASLSEGNPDYWREKMRRLDEIGKLLEGEK